jgi:hypothetical protein
MQHDDASLFTVDCRDEWSGTPFHAQRGLPPPDRIVAEGQVSARLFEMDMNEFLLGNLKGASGSRDVSAFAKAQFQSVPQEVGCGCGLLAEVVECLLWRDHFHLKAHVVGGVCTGAMKEVADIRIGRL